MAGNKQGGLKAAATNKKDMAMDFTQKSAPKGEGMGIPEGSQLTENWQVWLVLRAEGSLAEVQLKRKLLLKREEKQRQRERKPRK